MRKVEEISFLTADQVICKFDSGEKRVFIPTKHLKGAFFKAIVEGGKLKDLKVGSLGELYWENAAKIKDLNGIDQLCAYDVSPEFIYNNSEPIF